MVQLTSEQYYQASLFIEEVSKDPIWLLTCLTSTQHALNPGDKLTNAIWWYAQELKCHNNPNVPSRTLTVIEWLKEMIEAGEPVTFNQLTFPIQSFHDLILSNWRAYWYWLETGEYEDFYASYRGCTHPALIEKYKILEAEYWEKDRQRSKKFHEQYAKDPIAQERMKRHQQYQQRIAKEAQHEEEVA